MAGLQMTCHGPGKHKPYQGAKEHGIEHKIYKINQQVHGVFTFRLFFVESNIVAIAPIDSGPRIPNHVV
jgi:hypothetical protein